VADLTASAIALSVPRSPQARASQIAQEPPPPRCGLPRRQTARSLPTASPAIPAASWSGGTVVSLGRQLGSTESFATGINDAGQVVGGSLFSGSSRATEWSGGSIINLGGLPGAQFSEPTGMNNAGQAVGSSEFIPPAVPEPSTWAMMLLGFAGLAWAGYRRAKAGHATLAR
jgi:probable HAF family extracellular repeat protein